MQVSVETLEGLQRKMTVQLPAEKVNEIVDNKLRTIAKQVRLDGFRPGKVPLKVVKQRFGDHVRQEAYGELIQSTFYEAATGEKLNPAGEPKIDVCLLYTSDAADEMSEVWVGVGGGGC